MLRTRRGAPTWKDRPNGLRFVDPGHLNFHLKPDAPMRSDLPGFKPIPVEKIGLSVDEYRLKLPTDDEIDRLGKRTKEGHASYDVEDRLLPR